jgi:ATP-dependent helicase HepA
MLISTECGGEGRNFEFCTRLVLFDLPWNPNLVEQRIGRLDRIGRQIPVEVVYFVPPAGLGAAVSDLYAQLGLFERPLGGLDRELADVEPAIEDLALSDASLDGASHFTAVVREARHAYDRVQEAAYHELHREPFHAGLAEGILARVPPELEELTQDLVLSAGDLLELNVEPQGGLARYSIELGNTARIESLPGVPDGASFLGSFDREEAVADESIDFFASGHPLVEGLVAHLDESPLGRTGLLHVSVADDAEEGFGLLAVYRHGATFEPVAVDVNGRERPELARRLTRRPLRSRRVRPSDWVDQAGWATLVRTLAQHFEGRGRPVAVAAFRVGA